MGCLFWLGARRRPLGRGPGELGTDLRAPGTGDLSQALEGVVGSWNGWGCCGSGSLVKELTPRVAKRVSGATSLLLWTLGGSGFCHGR